MKVRDLIKNLEENGWIQVSQESSHRNFKAQGERFVETVQGKPGDDVTPGVLSDTRRKTGLPLR